jgi:hypothetical protein
VIDRPEEHRQFLVRLLWMMLLPALVVGLLSQFRGVNILSTADIHTERVKVKVVDRKRAAFQIAGFDVGLQGREPPLLRCASGLFTPGLGATITFGRIGDGPMQITVAPQPGAGGSAAAGMLETENDSQEFSETVYMELAKSAENDPIKCASAASNSTSRASSSRTPAPRMPVWGLLTVGQESHAAEGYDPEPTMILDGTFRISAHTALADELYEVASITIPAGGRIEATNSRHTSIARTFRWIKQKFGLFPERRQGDRSSQHQEEKAIWWGAVYVDSQKTALVLAAATEASKIALYRPNRKDADVFGVSTLAQFTQDPTLLRLYIILFVIEMLGALATWLAEHFAGSLPDRLTKWAGCFLYKSMGYLPYKMYKLATRIGRLLRGGSNG